MQIAERRRQQVSSALFDAGAGDCHREQREPRADVRAPGANVERGFRMRHGVKVHFNDRDIHDEQRQRDDRDPDGLEVADKGHDHCKSLVELARRVIFVTVHADDEFVDANPGL